MTEPLTETELKSWRVTLSTMHPTQTHPISGYWLERMLDTIAGLEAEQDRLMTDIGRWVEAYGPDLITYPSKEEIRAVNETPEFRIGRNATMQVVSEGLQAILTPAEEQEGGKR